MPDERARAAGERVYKSLWCWLQSEGPGFLKWRLRAEWVYRGSGPETLMIHESPLQTTGSECVLLLCVRLKGLLPSIPTTWYSEKIWYIMKVHVCLNVFLLDYLWSREKKMISTSNSTKKNQNSTLFIASALGAEDPKVSGCWCMAQQHYYHKRQLEKSTASSPCPLQFF